MGASEIISLAAVAVGLLSVIVLSFRALGARVEKLAETMTDSHDKLHMRISGHADKYVRREDHAVDIARLTAIIERGFDYRHTETKDGFERLEKMMGEIKSAMTDLGHENKNMQAKAANLETRIAIQESYVAMRSKDSKQ